MKFRILFTLFFYTAIANAQIDYAQLKDTWCKCRHVKNTQDKNIVFMKRGADSLETRCLTHWEKEVFIYTDKLEYTFNENDSLSIYEEGGYMLKENYTPDSTTTMTTVYDTLFHDNGSVKEITQTKIEVTIPVAYSPGRSYATIAYSSYEIDKNKGVLSVIDDGHAITNDQKIVYKILYLSEEKMIVKRILNE